MHARVSLLALKNVEPRNLSKFCENVFRSERHWLTGRIFFIELIGTINVNTCSFVSPASPCLTHTLPTVLSLLQQLHLISLWRSAVLHNPSSSRTAPFSSLLLLLLPSFPLGPGSHFVHPFLIYLQA